MTTVRRMARNTTYLYAAYAAVSVQALVAGILIARELGDAVFGKYSFAMAFTAIFLVFLNLGFPTLIVRDVARDKSLAAKYLGNIGIVKTALSLIILGVIALLIHVMDYPRDTTIAVLILGAYNVCLSFAGMFNVTFRAFEQMQYEALAEIARAGITLGLIAAALFLGYGLVAVACAILVGGVIEFVIAGAVCHRKFARPTLKVDAALCKKLTMLALPIAVMSGSAIIYTRIDTVMLSLMKGDEVVGWYNAAYNLILSLKPIPQLFMQAIFPALAMYAVSSRDTLKTVGEKCIQYLLMIGIPLAVGTTLLADRIIPMIYGAEFGNSVDALRILAWDALLFFAYVVMANILVAIDKHNPMAVCAVGCAVLNVVLNLILIPHFSYQGSAAATIATEAVLLSCYFYLLSRYLHRFPLHRILAKQGFASLVMGASIQAASAMNLAALVVMGVAIYFTVLYLVRGVSREDIAVLRQMVRR